MDYRLPIVLLWLIGLVCSLMPVPSLETQFFTASVFCTGLSFLLVLRSIYKHGAIVPQTGLMITGFLFWAVAFVSVLFSDVKLESYLYFWFFSALPLSFLIFTFLDDERLFKYAALGVGGVIAALAVINLYFYIVVPEWLYRGQAGWPFTDPNALAALLSLGFFAAVGVMVGAPQRWHSYAGLALALLFFSALMVTGSRAAILALVIALIVFSVLNMKQVRQHVRCLGALLIGSIALFGLMEFLGADHAITPQQMITTTFNTNIAPLDVRPDMWHSTWAIIKDHMWTGTGIGTFFLYYPEVRGGDYATAGLHAHNDPLEFWSDMGIAAPLLFYAFIAGAFVRTLRALKKADPVQRIHILIPFCALGAMIAHTHIEFNFYVLPTLMVTGLVLAYWLRMTGTALQEPLQVMQWPAAGVAFAALMVLFGLTAFGALAGSEMLIQKAEEARARGDIEEFASAVNRADTLSRGNNAKAFLLASSIPMGLLDVGNADRDALIKQAQELLDKARDLNPRSAAILMQQAQLAEWQGDPQRSIYLLEEAVTLNPLYLPARVRLADRLRSINQNKKAYELLRAGLRWPYDMPDAIAYYNDVATSALVFGDDEAVALVAKMKDLYEGRKALQSGRKTLDTAFSSGM